MRFQVAAFILAAAASASAQTVVGSAYGFAKGVTGGGSAAAVTPADNDELAKLLSDDTARVIYLDKEFDFTGKTATGAGCDRKSCSASNGGQLYLGDLSCGGDDNVAVSSVSYDEAGTTPLVVGSNKSIVGNGKGVIKGKGLSLKSGASNVIIQGIEITNINPGVVWGGDALDFKGKNDGVWVDHCKFSLIGRMFIVSHYDGSRFTLSNNEFDGVTTTSASCNDNHYWTMMFIADGDEVTLDRNYFHDVSGRAPKLGQDGVKGTFHASNNYFANMEGHAFDAYNGASALIEGNVFEAVKQPTTDAAAKISTLYTVPDSSAASACSSAIGRACVANEVDSKSGKLAALKDTSALSALSKLELVEPVAATEVKALVLANAGPSKVGASGASSGSSDASEEAVATPSSTAEAEAPIATTPAATEPVAEEPAIEEPVAEEPAEEPAAEEPVVEEPAAEAPSSGSGTVQLYGQCGGQGYSGATECVSGATCLCMNAWYSQCLSSSAKFQSSC